MTAHRVAVLPGMRVAGLSKKNPNPRHAARVLPLRDALTEQHATDAFAVMYVVPGLDRQPRINKPGLGLWSGAAPVVDVFFCDVDNGDDGIKTPWTDELLAAARAEYASLDVLSTCGIYHTANGRRFVQPLTRSILVAEVEPYYWAWLSRIKDAGIEPDKMCRDWTRLFRLPYVVRDGKRTQPNYIALDRMRPIEPPNVPAEELDAYRERGKPRAKRRAVSLPSDSWRSEVLASWQARVADIARAIPSAAGERHELYLCLSGAIASSVDASDLPAIVHGIALAAGDEEVDDRRKAAESTAERVLCGQAYKGMRQLRDRFPEVARVVEGATSSGRAAVLRAELAKPVESEQLSANEAQERLFEAISNAPPGVSLISADTGVGKTRAAIRVAVERARRDSRLGRRTVISVDKHALAEQIVDILRADDIEAQRLFGPLSLKNPDGTPVCIYHEAAAPLVAGGQSVQFTFCEGCELRRTCAAKAGCEGPEGAPVLVAPHALIGQTTSACGSTGLLVIDEPPPLMETTPVTMAELETAAECTDEFATGYADAIRPALESLVEWFARARGDTSTPALDAIRAGFDGQSDPVATFTEWREPEHIGQAPSISRVAVRRARSSAYFARRLGVASKVLKLIQVAIEGETSASVRVERKGDSCVLLVNARNDALYKALTREGATVLTDANAALHEPVLLAALDYDTIPHTRASAPDGAPVARTVIETGGASRSKWTPHGQLAVNDNLVRSVGRAFDWIAENPATKRVGLISYTQVRLAIEAARDPANDNVEQRWRDLGQAPVRLAEARERLAPIVGQFDGELLYGHYGALRGLDYMKDCDAVVTLGDPWPNLGQVGAEVSFWGLNCSRDERALAQCRAELEQAHGRLRTIHRTKAGRALHVGAIAPSGPAWSGGAVEVRENRGGRMRNISTMTKSELSTALATLGGVNATARCLGVSAATVSEWKRGRRQVPQDRAARLRELCHRV